MGLSREGFSRLKPLLPFAEQLPHGRLEPAACLANAWRCCAITALYMDQPNAVAAVVGDFILSL